MRDRFSAQHLEDLKRVDEINKHYRNPSLAEYRTFRWSFKHLIKCLTMPLLTPILRAYMQPQIRINELIYISAVKSQILEDRVKELEERIHNLKDSNHS